MINHHHPLGVPATVQQQQQQQQQQQFSSSYDYPPQPHGPTTDSLRPTLDTSSYYASMPQVAHHPSYIAPHGYYASVPHQQQQQQYALASSMSLKRKSPSAASSSGASPASAYAPMYTQDKLCDLCYHPDPILFSAACGHLFHSRCVHVWPLESCPVCDVAMPHVSVLRIDMNAQIDTRSGKWTRPEEKFIDCILAEFDRSSLPLANGTPVRLVLAKLLNCSTMRLSKKFQKNALGKRTFRIAKPTKGERAMAFDRADHVARQKEFSRLEAIFRHELVEQFRRENNTDDGAYNETQDLRHAVKQFWVTCFIKLAVVIGQPVQGLDVSDSKKKKHALVLIRNGQYDDLLGWNASPANTPTVAPMPHMVPHDSGAPWPSGYHVPPPPPPPQQQQQPVKKMRTPESMPRSNSSSSCDMDGPPSFDIQPAPPLAVATAYEYGKTSPRGYSPGAAAAAEQHYYAPSSVGYARSSPSGGYGAYPIKTEKGYNPLGAPAPAPGSYSGSADAYRGTMTHHQHHQHHHPHQQQTAAVAMASGSYQSSSGSSGASHQQQQQQPAAYPWDELLEGIAEPNPQVVDPALQAWSNLHIM